MPLPYAFNVTFDDVALSVLEHTTSYGRDIVQHRPASGDGAQVQDLGALPIVTRMTVGLLGDDEEALAARTALVDLYKSGAARRFVHPHLGPMRAKLEACEVDTKTQRAQVVVVEDKPFTSAEETAVPTLSDVTTAAANFDEAVDNLSPPLTQTVSGADLLQVASAWSVTTPIEQRTADVEEFRVAARAGQRELNEREDEAGGQAALTLMRLRGALEFYNESVQTFRRAYDSIAIRGPVAVTQILTDIYGAATAATLLDEVLAINKIRDPSRLPQGSTLRVPRP